MKVGYLRHTGAEIKKSDTQLAVLQHAGCDTFFVDDAQSKGAKLRIALNTMSSGDSFVVAKFDRLGKTIKGVVDLLSDLTARSVTFVAVEDGVDTSTAEGRYLVQIMTRLALMDKLLRYERTKVSLAIMTDDGRVIAVGEQVAKEVEAVALNSYRNFLKGQGYLRVHSKRSFNRDLANDADLSL